MKELCFGLVGFCLHLTVLTLAGRQFKACLVFLGLTASAFSIGSKFIGTYHMKPKVRTISDTPPADQPSAEPATGTDILPSTSASQAASIPDIFDEARIREDLARFAR